MKEYSVIEERLRFVARLLPRLISDEELAVILEAFVKEVAARPPKPSIPVTPQPGTLPAFRKRKSR